MRRLVEFFAKVYPQWWRDRYGVEFEALIEADAANLRTAWNVLGGALMMQLRTLAEGSPSRGMGMVGLLRKNWWLLAFGGIVQAAISILYLLMQNSSRPITFHAWHRTITWLGYLEFAAGICVSTAGLLRAKSGKSWLLVLNGLALAGLGFIHLVLMRFPISFRTIAFLLILMAFSVGMLELRIGRTLRSRNLAADGWAFAGTGLASMGFVLVFIAFPLRWIRLEPGSHIELLWMGFYFAFSAMCMLGSALRLHRTVNR
jgi:hypothetical protein